MSFFFDQGNGRSNDFGDVVRARLFERRIVMMRGTLDDALAGQTAAELMTLDSFGDEAITVHVDCAGGTLDAAFTVMDTIDLLGVAVHTVCVGRADGPAVGVVAVGTHRSAAPHARFHLTQPEASVQGTARELERWARHHEDQLARYAARLAEATRVPAERVEADLDAGRYLDAEEALRYRLIDEVMRPGADIRQFPTPPSPYGFKPPR